MPRKKRRRRRANLPLRLIIGGFLLFCLGYILGIPALEVFGGWDPNGTGVRRSPIFEWFERVNLRSIQVFFASWFFFVGSSIGSFANVVVYRMPRKMSVASKDSACPYCRQRIKLRHNIPVFGWLILRGRCYVCRLPISPRYPIVELMFGLVFLAMYFATLVSGAQNIPGTAEYPKAGILDMILEPHWDVVGLYLFHCVLASTLLTWALIRFDKMSIPPVTIWMAGLLGLVTPCFFHFLHPVDFGFNVAITSVASSWTNSLFIGAIGLVVGIALGLFSAFLIGKETGEETGNENLFYFGPHAWSLVTGFGLVGIFLGWQALLSAWCIFTLLMLIKRMAVVAIPFLGQLPTLFAVAAAVLVQVCCWKLLDSLPILPGSETNLVEIVVCLAIAVVLMIACRSLTQAEAPKA